MWRTNWCGSSGRWTYLAHGTRLRARPHFSDYGHRTLKSFAVDWLPAFVGYHPNSGDRGAAAHEGARYRRALEYSKLNKRNMEEQQWIM